MAALRMLGLRPSSRIRVAQSHPSSARAITAMFCNSRSSAPQTVSLSSGDAFVDGPGPAPVLVDERILAAVPTRNGAVARGLAMLLTLLTETPYPIPPLSLARFEIEKSNCALRQPMIENLLNKLEQRLGGRSYAQQRLGIETDHEAQVFGQGLTFFHIENWYSIHSVIRTLFKVTGLYWRGRANAARVQIRHNNICFRKLPPAFDGFTLLHMSDFHADMNDGAMRRLEEILVGLKYDLCVMTGDYRAATFGNFEDALALIRRVLARIKRPVYGVLGNHDTIRMVPDLEAMGIRMLLNECEPIERAGATIYL